MFECYATRLQPDAEPKVRPFVNVSYLKNAHFAMSGLPYNNMLLETNDFTMSGVSPPKHYEAICQEFSECSLAYAHDRRSMDMLMDTGDDPYYGNLNKIP